MITEGEIRKMEEELRTQIKATLLKMIGTSGYTDILAISRMCFHSSEYFENPEMLACHLLWLSIDEVKKAGLSVLQLKLERTNEVNQ